MAKRTIQIDMKYLNWRFIYKYWLLLALIVQGIITVFGFNSATNALTLIILIIFGFIVGVIGVYYCFVEQWLNALLMFLLFPLQCVAYVIGRSIGEMF